jgi:hypothetical protein
MLGAVQVFTSLLIYIASSASKRPDILSIRLGQRKDDALTCFVMSAALMSQATRAASVTYIVATAIIVWLARRTRSRLGLMRRQ